MTRKYIIVADDSLKGFDEEIAKLEREWGAEEIEPSEDYISREEVMKCFKKWQPYMATRLWDYEQELKALPSVTPSYNSIKTELKPCDTPRNNLAETSQDCISREEAIDRMMRKNMPVGGDNTKERFRYLQWLSDLETIKELPSVKPQRSKGRWIEQQDIHKHHYGWSFCSECGAFLISSDGANFCSCCGAEMEVDE